MSTKEVRKKINTIVDYFLNGLLILILLYFFIAMMIMLPPDSDYCKENPQDIFRCD